jgi:hypothetical protein
MGYTIQAGEKTDYSISSGTAAHKLTLDMLPEKANAQPAVQASKMPYSFRTGEVTPYSMKMENGGHITRVGIQIAQTDRMPARLGQVVPAAEAATKSGITMPAVSEVPPTGEMQAVNVELNADRPDKPGDDDKDREPPTSEDRVDNPNNDDGEREPPTHDDEID